MIIYSMMSPICWRKKEGDLSSFMINTKEDQPLKELVLRRRKIRWSRKGKGIGHRSSEIVLA
jgi:hypothetical protein